VLVARFDLLLPYLTPRSVLLHVGAGDGELAILAASYVERVYAVGLCERIGLGVRRPVNLRLGWPPPRTVHIAFSEQLDETLLPEIRASLTLHGKYLVAGKTFFPRLFSKGRLVAAIA
jgi:hypothetical protein